MTYAPETLLDRLRASVRPDFNPNIHWEWAGPTINTSPGRIARPYRGAPRIKFRIKGLSTSGDNLRVEYPSTKSYRSPQPISYMGELLTITQALYLHFLKPDLYRPSARERKLARNHLRILRRGGGDPSSYVLLDSGARALTGTFQGITLRACREIRGEGGMKCINPFHAIVIGQQTARFPEAVIPQALTDTEDPSEVASYMADWINRNSNRAPNLGAFAQLFRLEDDPRRPEAVFQAAVALLPEPRHDISPQWLDALLDLT